MNHVPLQGIATRFNMHRTIDGQTYGGQLTRRPKRVALLRGLELLRHGLLERRLCEARGAPHLELDMLGAIDALGEEHRREVHVGEVAAVERAQAVLGEIFDPFGAGTVILLWIGALGGVRVSVMAAHGVLTADRLQ